MERKNYFRDIDSCLKNLRQKSSEFLKRYILERSESKDSKIKRERKRNNDPFCGIEKGEKE